MVETSRLATGWQFPTPARSGSEGIRRRLPRRSADNWDMAPVPLLPAVSVCGDAVALPAPQGMPQGREPTRRRRRGLERAPVLRLVQSVHESLRSSSADLDAVA